MANYTALTAAGIDPGNIDFSRIGTWQAVPTEDKPGRRNGRVIVFSARPLRYWYTNHRTGISGYYGDDGGFVSREDQTRMRAARFIQDRQRDIAQMEAMHLAEKAWHESTPADPDHPYLKRKRVQPHGIRQLEDGHLVVPLRLGGMIFNLQTIAPDGTKLFLKGGRKSGCYLSIGTRPDTCLILCEGYATGASLHEALQLPVAVCFDAGNLVQVAPIIRRQFPRCNLILAADNDSQTPCNPGVTYATKAAAASAGSVIYPTFDSRCPDGSDWNDYANAYGLDAICNNFSEVANVG